MEQTTGSDEVTEQPSESALETYRSEDYGFELQYPSEWASVSPESPYANLEKKILALELPQSTYPDTNFGEATLAISAQEVDSLENCLALNSLNSEIPGDAFSTDQSEVVNGVTYYTASGAGAAAGNTYDYKLMRSFQNAQCFEVSETIHTSNMGNYDPGTVTEVDAQVIWNRLNEIFNTLTFMENTADLEMEDLKEGTGAAVETGDTVEVNYVGTLEDGTKFDSSKDHGKTFTFTVGRGEVIQGWDEGLLGMKEGGTRKLIIPSDMAYGDQGIPGVIPGGATLIFEVELVSIQN